MDKFERQLLKHLVVEAACPDPTTKLPCSLLKGKTDQLFQFGPFSTDLSIRCLNRHRRMVTALALANGHQARKPPIVSVGKLLMNLRRIAAPVAMLLGSVTLASAPAQAAYVINILQIGPDLVATGHGTVNTAALTLAGPFTFVAVWNADTGLATVGSSFPYSDIWVGPTGPSSFGIGGTGLSFDNSGEMFGVYSSNAIILPFSYVSGSDLGESRTTFANTTFASIGFTPGTYVWTWGAGADADSFTVNIGPVANPVPEPATWALMIGGLGLVGAAMRRRNTASVSFA